jgi:hypothetical protein
MKWQIAAAFLQSTSTGVSAGLTPVGVQAVPELLLSMIELFFVTPKNATLLGDGSFCTFIILSFIRKELEA